MADEGGGILWDVITLGFLGVGAYGAYVYKDQILAWINGGHVPPGCTKTCPTGQHLVSSSCTCVPNTCTKTCPTGQHINSSCNCVPNDIPTGGSLKFAAGGDAGTGRHPEPSVSIAKMIKSKGAQLFVGLGDYPYGNVCNGFTPFVNALGGVQGIWSMGNHDKDSCLSILHEPKWVFRLDKGPCTFIILNGNSFGSAASQTESLMKQATPRKWKFVCFHQPIVTPSSDHAASGEGGLKAVMKKWGVQACLQAHNHIYARSKKDTNGVTYFVLGTLGESHYSTSSGGIWVKTDNKNFGATFFNCTDTTCNGQFLSTNGSVIDSFAL